MKTFKKLAESNYAHNDGSVIIFGGLPTIVSTNGSVEQLVGREPNCIEYCIEGCKKWNSTRIPPIRFTETETSDKWENEDPEDPILFVAGGRLFAAGNIARIFKT